MSKNKKNKVLKEFKNRFDESIQICATDNFLEELQKKYEKDKTKKDSIKNKGKE